MTAARPYQMDRDRPDRRDQTPEGIISRELYVEMRRLRESVEELAGNVGPMAARLERAERDVQAIFRELSSVGKDVAALNRPEPAPRSPEAGAGVVLKPGVISLILGGVTVLVTILLRLADWLMAMARDR